MSDRSSAPVLDALGLAGISRLPSAAYSPIVELARVARTVGYAELDLESA